MSGWDDLPLGTPGLLLAVQPGYACGKKDVDGGVPHLRMNNVSKDGGIDMTLIRRIPIDFAEAQDRFLESGDVVFNNTNSTELVGKSCVFMGWEERCAFSNHLTKLRPNPKRLLSQWLHCCLRNLWCEGFFATNCTEFIGQSAFNKDTLLAVEIPVPPLAEQRRIVGRIEALTRQLEEARQARQSAVTETVAMFQAVVDRVFENTTTEPWVAIRSCAKVQGGYAFKSSWFVQSGIRLLRNQNVYHGELDWSDAVHLPPDRRSEFKQYELFEGNVVITMDRPLISTGLKAARIRSEDLPCLLLQRVGRFVCSSHIEPAYLFHFLNSQHFMPHISGDGRSSAVPHISAKQIEAIPIPLPELAEQRRIVARLDAFRAKVDELQRLQRKVEAELAAFTPALLAKAFHGEL
jgi:type I restriction enzyme S subunit